GEGPGDGRRDRSDGRGCGLLQDVVRDRIAIYRVVDGSPHAHVAERLLLDIERDPPDMWTRLLVVLELRILLDLLNVVGRHVDNEVHAARKQLGHPSLLLHEWSEDEAVELRPPAPVAGVRFEHDTNVLVPAHELERPGADRVAWELLSPLLHRSRAH